MKWLQISLEVDPELAEAVAELFSRDTPGNIAIEATHIHAVEEEDHPVSPLRVSAFIPIDEHLESIKHRIEQGLWHLGQIQTLPKPIFRTLHEEDWANSWRTHHRPLSIGKKFMILPPWISPSTGDRLPVILNPGMAFGTGTHPTTQLCLQAIETHLRAGQRVVDLGCGSGVLSIAAARLGASEVLAFDVDPEAVQVTEENIRLNHMLDRIQVKRGSLEDILREIRQDFIGPDLLVANILASTLLRMIKQGLHHAVRREGIAILSGILEDQLEPVLETAQAHCFQLVRILEQEDWRAIVLEVI